MSITFIPPREALEPQIPKDQVYDGSVFAADMSRGEIVFESRKREGSGFVPAIDELQSQSTKEAAIGFASRLGMPDPRLNGMTNAVYPVNKKGIPLDMVKDGDGNPKIPSADDPDTLVWAYRIRIPVVKKLV